jgi:UDP-3-O-[3-hydroxymyristoyl] glucosamine N-acyltransferase
VVGGQAGINGHIHIGAGSRIGAKSGVMADLPPRSEVVGAPAQPVKAFFKEVAAIRRWVRSGGPKTESKEQPNPDVD